MFRFLFIPCFLAGLTLLNPLAMVSANAPYLDDRKIHLRKDGAALGDLSFGQLLTCLETASFEDDSGPRAIDRKVKRLIVTTIHNKKWFFNIREEIGYIIIEGITVNTQYYSSEQDKSKHLLHILAHCKLPAED